MTGTVKSKQTTKERILLLIDVTLLAAASLTSGSGLILFFGFHVGEGAFRASAASVERLTWLNYHRLPALIVASALILHVALLWRPFVAQLRHGLRRKRGWRISSEIVFYVTFWTAVTTGTGVWALVSGSAPLMGPVPLGPLPHIRHHAIDVHNIAGFFALLLAANHVGHRWRRMAQGLRRAWLAS